MQASQLGIIGFGVLQIIDGSMSMGALIACVILSGRTLAPLAQIGGYSDVSIMQLMPSKQLTNL